MAEDLPPVAWNPLTFELLGYRPRGPNMKREVQRRERQRLEALEEELRNAAGGAQELTFEDAYDADEAAGERASTRRKAR